MSSGFHVHTFGCKVNTYDSGLLQKRLLDSGYVLEAENPDIHILNSCAVTQEASREAGRRARRLKKDFPEATVVLTGCAAQVDGKILDELEAVDLVIANSHKSEMESILEQYFSGHVKQKVFRGNIFRHEKMGFGGGEEKSHTRSFLKIQDGCNSFCTFCIIPFARGKSRSLPVAMLVHKINEMHLRGLQEVVLTGVHIGDYLDEDSPGGPFDLADLVGEVLQKTQIPRVRLTSLEPIEISDKLYSLFADPRLCPHFHMSIQSADTEVLKAMKRKYGQQEVRDSLERIQERVPGAFVGMDVITGFPGETETHFAQTVQCLEESPWTRIHVFPYSEREGTRGPLLPGSVPVAERKRRAGVLRALSANRYQQQALAQRGTRKKVLVFPDRSGHLGRGLSRDYWDVDLLSDVAKVFAGREIDFVVEGYRAGSAGRMNGRLQGRLETPLPPHGQDVSGSNCSPLGRISGELEPSSGLGFGQKGSSGSPLSGDPI